jgi:hypothetical protein
MASELKKKQAKAEWRAEKAEEYPGYAGELKAAEILKHLLATAERLRHKAGDLNHLGLFCSGECSCS